MYYQCPACPRSTDEAEGQRVTVPRRLDRQKSQQERDELVKEITDYRRQLEATPLANMGRCEDLAGRIRRAEKRLAVSRRD